MRPRRWRGAAAATAVVLAVGGLLAYKLQGEPEPAGSYLTERPQGAAEPPAMIYRTQRLEGRPMPSNQWWSSLAWLPNSENMYAHPLAVRAKGNGLGVSYPPMAVQEGKVPSFHALYREDLVLGLEGLNAPDARVDGYSDWTVDALFADGDRRLLTRIGHGMPYVYATYAGARPTVTLAEEPAVWSEGGAVVGLTVTGNHYGLFCPSDGSWERVGPRRFACNAPAGKEYLSLAVLPDNQPETLKQFAAHAFAFPVETRVAWQYEAASSSVRTTYTVKAEAREGTETRLLMALYPHQWQSVQEPLTGFAYASPRGTMKVLAGSSFTTVDRYSGLLPALPDLGSYDRGKLQTYLDEVKGETTLWRAGLDGGRKDPYWMGKNLNRVAQLIPIAEQLGDKQTAQRFLDETRQTLTEWFTARPGKLDSVFYYNRNWGTLIGYPSGYGADKDLNDHHFHYGMWVYAAATVAQRDPAWAAQYGDMVKLLTRDFASPDRRDPLFPFLRTFDVYAGHSWASGSGAMKEGQNQESSSEAVNAWAALILYGAATGDTQMRDLGIWGYTLETRAVHAYWFDSDSQNFPPAYKPGVIGRLFSSGGDHNTWWTQNPEEIHGINFLPITGASLYLGRNPAYVQANYAELIAENGGSEKEWKDILWSFQALADPEAVVAKWNESYTPEFGESRAHTYHWIHSLQALGQTDPSVTADTPLYTVFRKAGNSTYVACNLTSKPITVHFSDGVTLPVPARSTATTHK
ncbi:MAG TPA: glycosyl hydrolase [Symbiobacteriaceae bacterium]|nr:glycosyl hydrolase [Symbiobacteriaceae bacterium]